jgi:hypothetical protein
MLGLDLDSSRWESMLERRGVNGTVKRREEEENRWERRGYKYPQI